MYIKDGKPFTLTNGMTVDVAGQDAEGNPITEQVQLVLPIGPERLAELGITEVPDPVRPDDRWFWVSQNEDGTYTATPKDRTVTNGMVWEQIKAERDRRKVGGVKVKVGTTNKWFHSDDASRIQQIGLVMMGTNMPADLQWKTLDGSFVAMTPAVAGNVFAAAAANDQAIFAVAEGHRVALEASADPSTYDFSTGWPKIYGE